MNKHTRDAVFALCGTAAFITFLILCYLANPGQFK